jgi:Papain fold toxin 1, glutamine deamidase
MHRLEHASPRESSAEREPKPAGPASADRPREGSAQPGERAAEREMTKPLDRETYARQYRAGTDQARLEGSGPERDAENAALRTRPGCGPGEQGSGSAEPRSRAEYASAVRQDGFGDSQVLGRTPGSAGADQPGPARADVATRYPGEYLAYSKPPPDIDGPHQQPESWADEINDDRDRPGRDINCGECSRAVQGTWEGSPTVAAAMSNPDAGGEPVQRMSDWAGEQPRQASMSQIGRRMSELGDGSSAVVGCDWLGGGGHWFNAVNDGGMVKAVDGQSGAVERWPPSADGLGFDESDMRHSDAIYFDPNGKVVM